MKRGQIAALVAGLALGIAGVALGVILAREEGRDAARRFLNDAQIKERSSQLAASARKVGGQVAKTVNEQYQAQMPRAREAFNNVLAQAPQAANALSSVVPRRALNGKLTEE